MRFVIVSALGLALAACGSNDSATIETEDGEVAYDVDRSNGNVSATITTEDGEEMTIESGPSADVELPAGFSVYPGASVLTSTSVQSADGGGAQVVMSSSDTPENIVKFYRAQAEAAGIEIQRTVSSNGSQVIGGESPDGLAMNLSAFPAAEGMTTVQLIVGGGE